MCLTRPAWPGRDNLLTLVAPGDLFGELTLFDPVHPAHAALLEVLDTACSERLVLSWLRPTTYERP